MNRYGTEGVNIVIYRIIIMQQIFINMAHDFITISTTLAQYAGGHTGYGTYSSLSLLGLGIIIIVGIIGAVIQSNMMASMRRFSSTHAPYTGAEVARAMLQANGITDVRVTHTPGQLTDHYNPADRTVNLSESVYASRSVAAMAVAAHECGHAIQHARMYPWLKLRSELVPLVNIGSRLGQIVLTIGLFMLIGGNNTTVAWIGLALFGSTTLFSLVTLPVEFDASRRALAWLQSSGVADRAMHGQAQTALRWAAMTYVAAALSSIAMLVYYVFIILSHSNNRR